MEDINTTTETPKPDDTAVAGSEKKTQCRAIALVVGGMALLFAAGVIVGRVTK
jgi:hypothetical protein